MAHEIESAMFVATPAWHGLGTMLDAPPTVAEALKAAGLDWSVDLAPLFLADGTRISDRKAVVRASDSKVLGTVGTGFRTVQNTAALDWFQPMLDQGLADIEAAGSLRGGARVWVLAKMRGADSVIVPESDDRVAKYLLLAHGHDGSLAIRLGLTPTRVVCANTLSAAIGENATLRIRHTVGAANAMDAARDIIMRANKQFEYAADIFRGLAKIHVTAAQLREYIDTVFPPPKASKVIDAIEKTPAPTAATIDASAELSALLARPMTARESNLGTVEGLTKETRARIYGEIVPLFEKGRGNDMPGVAGTAWAAYNAVTEYISHERGRSDDNRVNSAWFGAESERAIQAAGAQFLGIAA